ncbi:DUF2894 domain-containing protein [Ramlibacter rhizophilus]|uniref:DUF2894 domain-containing protein n=1 Tax=Ramlibacter rhizophilus TaxID=1781167 RepID=A0A4Z0C3L2_9BURK|nr:DUF2894 domain-containing protein [Ramlibacter rhizophilus]TFZ04799.1 DUF2894 domain-containing protein [Ramlibacter rhizophilus]
MDAPEAQPLREALQRLQRGAAQRIDPLGLHALEALARRIPAQPAPVQQLLLQRVAAGIAALEKRTQAAAVPGKPQPAAGASAGLAALSALNARLRDVGSDEGSDSPSGAELAGLPEIRSARRFRHAWSRLAAQERIVEAARHAPEAAGPLNSHALVLRTLEWMQALSPDYLQHFLAHADTLLWLQDAAPPQAPGRPARRKRG